MKQNKLILILFFIWCSGAMVTGALLFAQSKLDVSGGDIDTPSLVLTPQDPAPAVGPEGQIYYNEDNNQVYISDNTNWRDIAIPRNVATIIVAASDSLDPNKADPAYRCDGTNDQDTIQAAIDACPAYNPITGEGGGVVYLLEGTYNISAPIVFDNGASDSKNDSCKALIGAGAGTVLRIPDGTNATFNVINGSSANLLISKLKIDGNQANVMGTISGISFSGVTYSKVDKVWIENMRNNGISIAGSSSNNIISHNSIQLNILDGISLASSSNNAIINNNVQLNGNRGVVFTGSSNNLISGNNLQSNGDNGIYLSNSSNNNLLSANTLQSNVQDGIKLFGSCNNNLLSANTVQSNVGGRGIYLNGSCNNNLLSANNLQSNNQGGIHLYNSSNNTLSGNIIYDNGGAFALGGIKVEGGSSNLIFSNYISDTAGLAYGVDIISGDENYLVGNQIVPWAGWAGAISDSGTKTKYTGKDKVTLEPSSNYYLESGTNTLRFGFLDTVPNPDEQRPAPISHLVFNETANRVLGTSGADAIEDGKSAGDLLILGNSATFTVMVPDDQNTALSGTHILGQYDTLELIWDGLIWVEVSWTDVP